MGRHRPTAPQSRGRAKQGQGKHQEGTVAVGLCRCSTDRQDRSVEEQEAAIRAWAKERRVRILKVFKDEGVSGLELSRPGLNACLDFLKKSSVKGSVVLWSRDRLVRPDDPIDGLVIERQVRHAGWELRYLTGSNATGHPLVDAILGLVEHHASAEYLRKLARDSLRNVLGRLKAGDVPGGKIPFGYAKAILDGENRVVRVVQRSKKHRKAPAEVTRLVLGDEREVSTVRLIFSTFLTGEASPRDIADDLKRQNAPRPTALPWSKATVREILLNPVYVGDIVWNRETSARCVRLLDGTLSNKLALHASRRDGRRIAWARNDPKDHIVLRDHHAPIISRQDFARAQDVMAKRAQSKPDGTVMANCRSFPLTGTISCGSCGTGMSSRTTQVRSRVYRYYVCTSSSSHSAYVRADEADRAILDALRRAVSGSRSAPARRALTRMGDLEDALLDQDWSRARRVIRTLIANVTVWPAHNTQAARSQMGRRWRAQIVPAADSERWRRQPLTISF